VLEAEEYFSPGQKGSSAMPHKRNPVLTENLTGLARMVRSAVTPALENVALWHERDISHSSVERYIGPDATITLDFALARLTGVVDKLLVYPARMQKNLDRMGGLVHSQRVLLALTQAGMSREDAYKAVQRSAGAVAIGPVLQGLNMPVNDLSRGCTVTDIVNTVAITAIQAQSADHQFADPAEFHRSAGAVDDNQIPAVQRQPDADRSGAVESGAAGHHGGFGRSVGVPHFTAVGDQSLCQLGRTGLPTENQQPDRLQGLGRPQGCERRHRRHHSDIP
jgi:hypothetical protein